jgi:hypothetical protein
MTIAESEKSQYYISTGKNHVYYTLWRRPRSYSGEYAKDVYLCNLSIKYTKAIVKAKNKLGFVPEIIDEPFNKPRERRRIISDVIRFGKYRRLPVWFVYKYDPDYIGWMYENCDFKKALPNINYIKLNYSDFIKEYKESTQKEVESYKQYKKDRKRRIIAEKKASKFIGTIKKREDFTVKVVRIIQLKGYFDFRYLHIMKDSSGNELIWDCSNVFNKLEEKKTYRIKATVKSHQIYDSKIYGETVSFNQTALTRVKVINS